MLTQTQPSGTTHPPESRAVLEPASLLTPEQAATVLGLSVKTLATWRSTGRHALPFIRCGARIRYQRADLDAWLADRQHTSTATREAAE